MGYGGDGGFCEQNKPLFLSLFFCASVSLRAFVCVCVCVKNAAQKTPFGEEEEQSTK